MKKFIAILLSALCLLTACASGTEEQTTETSAYSEETVAPSAPGIDIYADGDGAYKIVRPDTASSALISAGSSLHSRIKEITGKTITYTTDWIRSGDPYPEYEILVGNTNRPESAEALEKINGKGWIVCTIGNKIVINATKDKLLEQAVEYFIGTYIKADKSPIPTDMLYKDEAEYNTTGQISILFVGNSLTQDGIAYLPYLLENYFPDIDFKFYMWYIGGATLADSYSRFTANEPCDIFSVCENVSSWNNTQKPMSWILKHCTFDIVCMQEYFNYKTGYTDSDLEIWNKCHDYITEHYTGTNQPEFISLFHAPKRDRAASIYELTLSANKTILSKTVSDDIIPVGIAVKLALDTALNKLGDQGGMSPDGTHCQEGLPCMVQTYTALLWLLDRLDIDASLDTVDAKITDKIYNSLNIPGANLGTGVITGTDEEIALAKEIAQKAFEQGQQIFGN